MSASKAFCHNLTFVFKHKRLKVLQFDNVEQVFLAKKSINDSGSKKLRSFRKIISANYSQQQATPDHLPKNQYVFKKWWQVPGVEEFRMNLDCHFISYILTYLKRAWSRFYTNFCFSDCKRFRSKKRKKLLMNFFFEPGTCCCPKDNYFLSIFRFESQTLSTSKEHIVWGRRLL